MPDKGRGHMYRKKRVSRKTYPKKTAPKSTQSLVKLIKNINIKEAEVKYKTTGFTHAAMVHDNIYQMLLWSNSATIFPGQGTTDGSRVGDRIVCQGLKIRAVFDVPWDRKNVKLKVFYLPWNSDQGTPTTYGQFFHDITTNARLDPVQTKRWPGVKYLGTYQIEPERAPYYTYSSGDQTPAADVISANTGTICVKKWIPMNKKLYFKADASTSVTNLKENGSIICIPYTTINTASTGVISGDNVILKAEMAVTVYYKDI
jgi:hypothetical protein